MITHIILLYLLNLCLSQPQQGSISVAFPSLSSDDSQTDAPLPCFIFQGNAEFLMSFEQDQKAKIMKVEIPKNSLVSGNCSLENNFVSVSGVFNTNKYFIFDGSNWIYTSEPMTCGISINFSKVPDLVKPNIMYSQFKEMHVSCTLQNINVSAYNNESFVMTPIGYSYTCGRSESRSAKLSSEPKSTMLNLAPNVDLVLRSFRIEIFPTGVNNPHNSSTPNNGNGTEPSDPNDTWDKYFGPAIHCEDDHSKPELSTSSHYNISTIFHALPKAISKIFNITKGIAYPTPNKSNTHVSDVRLISTKEGNDHGLHLNPEYVANNPDWSDHLVDHTAVPRSVEKKYGGTDANITVSIPTTTSSSFPNITTSVHPPVTTPSTTTTTPTPITIKPDTVPQILQAMIFYENDNLINDHKKACLALESSFIVDVKYPTLIRNIKTNKTELKNTTARVAIPHDADVTGQCGQMYYLETIAGKKMFKKRASHQHRLKVAGIVGDDNVRKMDRKGDKDQDYEEELEGIITYSSQSLNIRFRVNGTDWGINMVFITPKNTVENHTKKEEVKTYYALHSIQISVDTHAFGDAFKKGRINESVTNENVTHKYLQANFNMSLICTSETVFDIFGPNVTLRMYNTKFHPFIPKNFTLPHHPTNSSNSSHSDPHIEDYFTNVWICTQDRLVSDMVPIAVGSALAILILLVLVAYFIGRRRRSSDSTALNPEESGPSFWSRIFRRPGAETPGAYQPID